MKLYLAHPFDSRHIQRRMELILEENLGIDIINPFFDVDRQDKELMDDLGTTLGSEVTRERRYGVSDNAASVIVERDIQLIAESDGIVAIIDGSMSYGTIMEIVYANLYSKDVYLVVTNGQGRHPWLRYHAKQVFETWSELQTYLVRRCLLQWDLKNQ